MLYIYYYYNVCMFTVSNALLMSGATAMVRVWWNGLVETCCDSVVDVV